MTIELKDHVLQQINQTSEPNYNSSGIVDDVLETGSDIVRGGVQGWYFDLGENILDMASPSSYQETEEEDNIFNTKGVLNLPFLENYDSKKPLFHFMKNSEFQQLREDKKLSYLPKIIDETSVAGNFTRNITKIARGLNWGNKLLWGKYGGMKNTPLFERSPYTARALDWFGPSAMTSQIAFSPYEERLANMMSDIVEDTPVEGLKPFFDWIEADDEDTETEARFKMFLETVVVDAAFGGVFRLFKSRRDLFRAHLKSGDDPKALQQATLKAQTEAEATKVTNTDLPTSKQKPVSKTEAQRILETKDKGVEDVFINPQAVKAAVKEILESDPDVPLSSTGFQVLNTNYLESSDAKQVYQIFERLFRNELIKKNTGRPLQGKGSIQEEGEQLVAESIARSPKSEKLLHDTALQLDEDFAAVRMALEKDVDSTLGLDARIYAYRTMLSQLGDEISIVTKKISNEPSNEEYQATFLNLMGLSEDTLRLFGAARSQTARATTGQRIKIPQARPNKSAKEYAEELVNFRKALKVTGTDEHKIKVIAELVELGQNPLQKIRNARKGMVESASRRGMRGVTELYRSMLLASVKTHVTNSVSGTIETVYSPVSHLVGGILFRDASIIKYAWNESIGMLKGFFPATRFALKTLIDERNVLDPMGFKVDGMMNPYGPAIAMKNIRPETWHPYNWGAMLVNKVGETARLSIRLLGGEDEFFKQIAYRGRAYADILDKMPSDLANKTWKKGERNNYISKELAKYFDDAGMATDKNLLEHSRRITFTQELQKDTLASSVYKLSQKYPPMQFMVPFIRTPANIFDTFKHRTPVLNLLTKSYREALKSPDKIVRAQAASNMALGVGLYYMAFDLVSSGNVTGSGPTDYDRNRIWVSAGFQPYSIKLANGRWVSYNRLDPLAMPFAFVASTWENTVTYAENPDDIQQLALAGVASFMKAATDRTYLQGLKQMFDATSSLINGDINRAQRSFSKILANFVPSIIEQIADIGASLGIYEGATGFKEALTLKEQLSRRAAPLTGYNAIKHNWITGEPIMTPWGHNLGIPSMYADQPNKYIEELVRMGRSFDPPATHIQDVELSGPQYAELNRLIGTIRDRSGRTLMDTLATVMESPQYNYDPNRVYNSDYDDFRVTAIKKILRGYKTAGWKTLLNQDVGLKRKYIEMVQNKVSVAGGGPQLFDLHKRS